MTTMTPTTALTIRTATVDDVPRLVALGCDQIAAVYDGVVLENPAQLAATATQLVTGPAGAVFVAERDGALVGMIGLVRYVHHLSGVVTAGEVMWWMDPAARGGGVALLTRAERWAAETGARQLQMIAPAANARVGRLYERRGYRAVETSYQADVTPAMTALVVVDDVLPAFDAYRAATLRQPFGPVEPSPGVVFEGIAPAIDDALPRWVAAQYPGLTPTVSFVRQSPAGQTEPNFIHTDADMGDWSAIAYLTADPAPGDGTLFWRWRETGAIRSVADTPAEVADEHAAWTDRAQWEPWTLIAARPNRLVLFPSAYFHSRALVENYGTGDSARLIQVVFGTGDLPTPGGASWR